MSSILKKVYVLILIVVFFLSVVLYSQYLQIQIKSRYETGVNKVRQEKYQEGIEILKKLGDYKNCGKYIEYAENMTQYNYAVLLFNNGAYEEAVQVFSLIESFLDSQTYINLCLNKIDVSNKMAQRYKEAVLYYESEHYTDALYIFKELGDYEDCEILATKCKNVMKRLEKSITLSAGVKSSGGVMQNGNVLFCGEYNFVNDISKWKNIVSISVLGDIVIGLKMDGTVVVATQTRSYHFDTATWTDIIAISAGGDYIVGLREDGTIIAQGHNGDGQTNVDQWSNIIAIDTAWRTTVGLDSTGNINVAGYGSNYFLHQISLYKTEWTDIVAVSIGGGLNRGGMGHIVGLRRDGTVVAIGENENNQCNVNNWNDIVAISASDTHTVGLKSDGTVLTTQTDSCEEINTWKNIVAITAGYGFTLGLKADGTVIGAGYSMDGQRDTDNWADIAFREEWGHIFNEENW